MASESDIVEQALAVANGFDNSWTARSLNRKDAQLLRELAAEILRLRQSQFEAVKERCAKVCDCLGDEAFTAHCKKGSAGIAALKQFHYIACAKAIRALKEGS